MKEYKVNASDYTASTSQGLIFLTAKFEDGHYLGFYSHSPWGRIHNQERGWAVVSPEGEIVDMIETYSWGSCGFGFHEWRREQKEEHGRAKKLLDDFGNQKWKMKS